MILEIALAIVLAYLTISYFGVISGVILFILLVVLSILFLKQLIIFLEKLPKIISNLPKNIKYEIQLILGTSYKNKVSNNTDLEQSLSIKSNEKELNNQIREQVREQMRIRDIKRANRESFNL